VVEFNNQRPQGWEGAEAKMPVYCYVTKKGHVFDRFFPVGQAPKTIMVDRKTPARRCFEAESVGVPAKSGWPLTCVASGVNADQAGELRDFLAKKGVPTEVTSDGDPVYRDARHRKKALKARGFVDRQSFL